MSFNSLRASLQQPAFGLLAMRVTIGILMVYYGATKFLGAFQNGGLEQFGRIGQNVAYIGIPADDSSLTAVLFGLAAACAELFGGLLMIAGWWFRPAAFFLFCTMLVATVMKIQVSEGALSEFAYPLVMGMMVFGLFWTGPGRFSFGEKSAA
ncbi:MAG: hypothetical protein E1N59_1057 [Puniceicoccaceae bacterium 5H]|nr:MAG: hypothetical protein E1N59_1057 [Puniceicoccaceae bacterium 5H]